MKNEINGTLKIPMGDEAQVKHLQRARNELGKAGVSFDSGYGLRENIFDWALDYSLKGAKLTEDKVLIFDITAADEKKEHLFLAEENLWLVHILIRRGFIDDLHHPFWNHRFWELGKIKGAELVIRK